MIKAPRVVKVFALGAFALATACGDSPLIAGPMPEMLEPALGGAAANNSAILTIECIGAAREDLFFGEAALIFFPETGAEVGVACTHLLARNSVSISGATGPWRLTILLDNAFDFFARCPFEGSELQLSVICKFNDTTKLPQCAIVSGQKSLTESFCQKGAAVQLRADATVP